VSRLVKSRIKIDVVFGVGVGVGVSIGVSVGVERERRVYRNAFFVTLLP
jgi:hypothetical protein